MAEADGLLDHAVQAAGDAIAPAVRCRSPDYGYVAASTDDGRSWTTLAGQSTSAGDPTGSNYGVGFTGKSGGSAAWIDESVDLTRLRRREDPAALRDGDRRRLQRRRLLPRRDRDPRDRLARRAGARLAGGEGCVRIRNRVPQRVAAAGRGGRPATAGGRGRHRVGRTGSADAAGRAWPARTRRGMVVSGLTPLTSETHAIHARLERGRWNPLIG